MSTEPIDIERDFKFVYGQIEKLRSHPKFKSEVDAKVGAHIRFVTGGKHMSPGTYQADPDISDTDKHACCLTLFNALIMKGGPDWSRLKGSPANGAVVVEADPPAIETEKKTELECSREDELAVAMDLVRTAMARKPAAGVTKAEVEDICKRLIGEALGQLEVTIKVKPIQP